MSEKNYSFDVPFSCGALRVGSDNRKLCRRRKQLRNTLGRVFVVNKYTKEPCIHFGLFGVPDTARAANQIHLVQPGEKLFLYVHGVKHLYGVYRAAGRPFREIEPNRGPWIGRSADQRHGWYPFRIEVEPVHAYREPLSLGDIEKLDVELSEYVIRARSSVVYIREESTAKIELALDKKNENSVPLRACVEKYQSKSTPTFDVDLAKGSKEEKLTFTVQSEIQKLEAGMQALQAFYPIRAVTGRNVWIDILAQDSGKSYVVVELKDEELQESIWNQVFHYTWILRSRLGPGTKVRAIVVCRDAEPKLAQAYNEIKRQLKEPDFLKVYKYFLEPTEFGFRELFEP